MKTDQPAEIARQAIGPPRRRSRCGRGPYPRESGISCRMATADDLGQWNPLSPPEIGSLFAGYAGIWCIAGGWSLDLSCSGTSRPHDDIDVLVLRRDLALLHDALPGWELHAADGSLTPWLVGTPLPDAVHDIWCRMAKETIEKDKAGRASVINQTGDEPPWRFQLMVLDTDGDDWLFRRDDRIRGSLRDLPHQCDGLPVLAPEIQLLYKARLPNRPKDEADLTMAAPHLTDPQRRWLRDTISLSIRGPPSSRNIHGSRHCEMCNRGSGYRSPGGRKFAR